MLIDIIFLFIIVAALVKGYSNGLIVAVFSFAALIIGLAAALKLSSTVAVWLQTSTSISGYWLPFLSFALVMIAVIFLVKLGARFIEKTVQFVMMGWINKLGGIVLYAALYTSIFSVLLFFFNNMHLIKQETFAASKSYWFIEPFASKIITGFGKIIPIFQNTFHQLEDFFATKVAA